MAKIADDLHPLRKFRLEPGLYDKLVTLDPRNDTGPTRAFQVALGNPAEGYRRLEDVALALFMSLESFEARSQFAGFWAGARSIFEIGRDLCSDLQTGGFPDGAWADLRLPSDEFYVAWGDFGQRRFQTQPECLFVIDGAYVHRVRSSALYPGDALQIRFTSRLVTLEYEDVMGPKLGTDAAFGDPTYARLLLGVGGKTLTDAVTAGQRFRAALAERYDTKLTSDARNLAQQLGLPRGQEAPRLHTEKEKRAVDVTDPLMPLLFRAIAALIDRSARIEERIPASVPSQFVEVLHGATTPEMREAVLKRLAKRGLAPIRFVR